MAAGGKALKHRAEARLQLFDENSTIRIKVDRELVEGVCLALTLLSLEEVDIVALFDSSISLNTRLELCRTSDSKDTSSMLTTDDGRSRLELVARDLKTILCFLLRYYRDGYGAVDHIDIEVDAKRTNNDRPYVTVVVADSAPPVSDDEARRRLGLG